MLPKTGSYKESLTIEKSSLEQRLLYLNIKTTFMHKSTIQDLSNG